MKEVAPNWPSTFWHQQMRAQQCFRMVKAAEARRGVRYDWVVRARPEFASSCVCPPSRPLSPSRIYSIDSCNIRPLAPLLCDAFWLVPRQWADVVFNAVDGWADCGAYKSRFPCHESSGLAPECMLTAWLVDHGIPRSAFGEGAELRELGIVRDYEKRQPKETTICHLGPGYRYGFSECAARAKHASRDVAPNPGKEGRQRARSAGQAPQFSRGQLIGQGCCRTMGGGPSGLRAWDEPSTVEAIAAKRVHDRPMNRTTCAVQCAALKRCTHFELSMHGQPARSNQGVCSVFASGGYSVTTACKDQKDVGKRKPRMHCFAAAAYDHWPKPHGLSFQQFSADMALN